MASFYDTFVRANNPAAIGTSDSGAPWTNLAGTLGILANQVYNPSGALAHSTVDLGMSDCVVRWQIPITQNATAVLVRCTNVNNLWYIRNKAGTNYALAKVVAGVFTEVANGGHPQPNDYLTVRCQGPNITLYVNGIQAFTYSDSFNQTETHFGIRCNDANTRYGAMAAQALSAAGSTWHVKTTGTWFGDGSSALPWDFRTAMTYTPGIVQPLDQITVHGGTYQTSGDLQNYVLIGDGSTNYIDVRRAAGENWPVIRTGIWCQLTAGGLGGVRFWGLQIVQDNYDRFNNYHGLNPSYGWGGMLLESPNTEFHYCIIANNAGVAGGWFYGEDALNAKVHMCLTYYNGFRDTTNGLPAGQGFYRQADDAGTGKYQYIDTCITGLNYQSGMQIYGSGASNLNHARTDKSFWFYGGYLGSSYAGGQAVREVLLGSTSDFVSVDQVYFDKNWLWRGTSGEGPVQLGYNGHDNAFTSWTNNITYGRYTIHYFRTLESTGNITVMPDLNGKTYEVDWTALIGHPPTPVLGGIDNNFWYQTNDGVGGIGHGPFATDDGVSNPTYLTIPPFYAVTGHEQHSTLATYASTPSMNAVYGNTAEPAALWPTPRAFVYVFDMQSAGTATLDVSSCSNIGDQYAIYHWGDYELNAPTPVATGTYLGTPIVLTLGVQPLPTLNADPTGIHSQHDALPAIPAGQPAAYIYAVTTPGTPVTPIDTESPTGLWVVFHAYAITQGGMVPGDRYYVCHSSDILPEKYGRIALQAGIWQGGDIQCYVGSAYPNSTGPFFLIKEGFTGCYWTAAYEEPLHHDAVVRAAS